MDETGTLIDVSLIATVGVIFLITLVGAYLRSRRRDACLKAFQDYPVTIESVGGKIVWGELEVESNGLELHYRSSVHDGNHVESSYLMYASEFCEIQAIYRYVDELPEEDKERRQRQLNRYFHPGPFVRVARKIQHFFALAGDSIAEVLSYIMGSLRRPAGRYITDASDTHIQRFSTEVVGSMGGEFDPLIERLIGQKVVFDLVEGDELHEHVGILKNYSPDFIELLDVQFPQLQSVAVAKHSEVDAKCLKAVYQDGLLRVTNHTGNPMLIQALLIEGEEELLNVVVGGHETLELHPPQAPKEAELRVRVVRELDMIVPRSRATVRHRAERYAPEVLPEIIFDLGVRLRGDSVCEAREARLRRQLEEFPGSALAASNLGALLIQKQEFAEALKWLEKAYAARFSLPDNGLRTNMLLNELRRRVASAPDQAAKISVKSQPLESATLPVEVGNAHRAEAETAVARVGTRA
jgi:hypothetical protein